jgi:hypothetical protein
MNAFSVTQGMLTNEKHQGGGGLTMRIDYVAPRLEDRSAEAAKLGVAMGVHIRKQIRHDIASGGTPLSFLAALPLSV